MDVEGYSDLGEHIDAIVPAVSNDIVQSSSHLACIDAGSPIIETNPKERIHVCAPELKPVLGMIFDKLEDGLEFYKAYAANSGFKMRKSTQRNIDGVVMTNLCVCGKFGESKPREKVKKRQRTRILCNAKIFFRRNEKGQYVIVDFHEGHTHLLSTPNIVVHLTESRELTLIHKSMIVENSKVNKGPVQSFKMFKEYVKGYQNVGASLEDFNIFWRDVKKFIKGYDAQMMIENFMHKKAMCSSYYFDFDVDDRGRLSRVCWFDPIAIKNYSLFGDMTFFDTTFNMNTYKMIFAPLTGVDHHKKCVTFGAGLIRKETDEHFVWLFQNFLSAMSNKYPVCIITDQDRGIRAGVKTVFGDKNQHRYCMWHIMKKLPDKIGTTLYRETNFMKELCSCVWAEDIEPSEFEERWCAVIPSYGLTDNEWLDTMFDKRASWIPAYFRDLFMGGLMRTTSRSESENSFFGNFMNPNLTLVEFLMRFESAMDAQRWKQSKLIAESKNFFPDLETPHPLEKHASEFCTPVMFSEFKNEWVDACFTCGVKMLGVTTSDNIPIIDREKDKVYYVNFISDDMKVNCTCKKFERHGILCRHALYVLKEQGLDNVPDRYH
ncbi:protein FAR1-RELATED SEQUENCE 5-like [Silene latifolia]|uniref:protein FAR1-RELATED SEQUENCE 5-like n=1 Tax=Silene latifolia TaxID=37657 RepID=UPI003D76DAD2